MIEKIYFDMDGVLADFDRGVRELCGIEPGNQSQNWDSGRDVLLWSKVREVDHFYDELEPMPGAITMFDIVYQTVGARCEILTGILFTNALDALIAIGKLEPDVMKGLISM